MRAEGRIRVAHVITRMIVGGAQETVLLAAALADRARFDPVVVCGPQTGSEGSLHDEVRRRGVELVVVPELVREVAPVTDLRAVPALVRVFGELQPDVVHTNSSKAGIVGRVAARRANVPRVIHTVHGWPFHAYQRGPVRRVWQELERRTAPLADRLVVVADADREKGLATGIGQPEQYVTVRSGLELEQYVGGDGADLRDELGIARDTLLIGAVSRLSPQKDPLTLIAAFAAVARHRDDVHLLVVGDGPLRAQCEAAVSAEGVDERVVFVGLRPDVPRLMRSMDVFVSTSRWEGLPRTIIAAMATGVPVVATRADGVVDVVTDQQTGLLAAPVDTQAIALALRRLVDDQGLRDRLAAAASARVAEFGAGTMVRRLEALYEGSS